MQSLNRKIISVKTARQKQTRRAAFLLAGRLTLAAVFVLPVSCVSVPLVERLAAMSIYYIPLPALEREPVYGQFFGKKNFIKEVSEQMDYIYRLAAPYAFSVPAQLLPQDITEILQKYLLPNKNQNYYNYILDNVDRIIFCPKIILKGRGKALGVAMEDALLDEYLYPAERLIYIDSLYHESRRIMAEEVLSKAITIVHEAAHRELFKLILELKLDRKYYQGKSERYACIIEEAFCQYLLADPAYVPEWTTVRSRLKRCTAKIEDYNHQLGLVLTDRTLLP
jgi:hypothetical protein